MKIAFVSLGFGPLRLSGLDVSGERLVKGLLETGHQVTVVAGRKNRQREVIQHPALQVIRIPVGRSDWIGFAWRAGRLLNEVGGFDAIHFWDVHFAYRYEGAYVASLQHSFQQRMRGLGDGEGGVVGKAVKRMYYGIARRLAERPGLERANGLLAGSLSTAAAFARDYGIPESRLALARHGIDTDFYQPSGEARAVRKSLGLAPRQPVLLYAGFFTPRKGLTYLARALRNVEPEARLVLIGRWRSASLRAKFWQTLGPAQGQVIEAGFVPDAMMPAYFSMADVYVSPSLMEGFGLPLAEALSCGTPVVAAEAGSVAEVVGPGGLLVPARDPNALGEAVTTLLADGDLRRQLGQAGAAHVRANFTVEKMVRDTLAGYRRFFPDLGGE